MSLFFDFVVVFLWLIVLFSCFSFVWNGLFLLNSFVFLMFFSFFYLSFYVLVLSFLLNCWIDFFVFF